ncbi:MAG: NADH-quinone oxidoreductase subunit A [Ignavibacteria bacterium]
MLKEYIPIVLILGFAVSVAVISILLSSLLGPKNPHKEKLSTYESGMEPIGTARERFTVKFYMVAVSFIIFDIEIVFLYPFAVSFIKQPKTEMLYPLIFAILFAIILFLGLLYEYKKGVLKWD